MKFTVLIPTFSNGAVIRNAIESVLAQPAEFELFVVSDGAPLETLHIMDEYCERDARVRCFKFDKGERHGEAWRHLALQNADSDAVCYLSDDDFWLNDHLLTMREILGSYDFCHTRQVNLMPDFTVNALAGDLSDETMRARLLTERCNFFGLSVVGHRLDAYRRLQEGWAPAPPDIATDFHMWRKWLAAGGMHFHSSGRITALHLARIYRPHQTPAACASETGLWRAVFADPFMIDALRTTMPANDAFLQLHTVVTRGHELRTAAAIID